MRTYSIALVLLGTFLVSLSVHRLQAEEPGFKFQDGDRVTLLGAGFIERLQQTGYLETVLTSRLPNLDIGFRNLGWSGDTVWGEARSVFGGQQQGFERLLNDVKLTEPTVILIAYGDNEAHAGEADLLRFEQGLQQLLDNLAQTNARLVLLSPLERENLGPPLPDPTAYNAKVKLYADAIKRVAAERELAYVELNPIAERDASFRPSNPRQQLTTDTLTLTPYGTWIVADRIATALGVPSVPLELTVEVGKQEAFTRGGIASELAATEQGWKFELQATQLPYAELFEHVPPGAEQQTLRSRAEIKGLPAEGTYRLLLDDKEVARGSAAQWSKGIAFTRAAEQERTERLRRLINTKNQLFFNRYRPQNETYLFLFRKHEQGNNAVEIPQFDPLIESKEHEIAAARVAEKQRYALERVE